MVNWITRFGAGRTPSAAPAPSHKAIAARQRQEWLLRGLARPHLLGECLEQIGLSHEGEGAFAQAREAFQSARRVGADDERMRQHLARLTRQWAAAGVKGCDSHAD